MTLEQFLNVCIRISNSIWVRNHIVSCSGYLVLELADVTGEGFKKVDQVLRAMGFDFREELHRSGIPCRTYAIERSYRSCSYLHRSMRRAD
ncbi:hypothetical protein [Hydrogenophaga sp. NFH-34]|uniref:hypothetical protein n=1 Tax=Hydrogenophaga sp. NFH-34 TaxID=2744446 RepID=UPI001F36AB4A|nr:hypothetical protein [Hydrogenophaga sp. NFH-34]